MADTPDKKTTDEAVAAADKIKTSASSTLGVYDQQLKIIQQLRDAMNEISLSLENASKSSTIAFSSENIGKMNKELERTKKSSQDTTSFMSKFGNSIKGPLTKSVAIFTGGLSGVADGFKNIFALGAGIASFVGSVVKGFFEIGAAIIAIPFDIMDHLFKIANKGGDNSLAVALEKIREKFGNLRGEAPLAIRNVVKHMGELDKTGVSAWAIFGNLAQRYEAVTKLAVGLGQAFSGLVGEVATSGEAMMRLNMGLGITDEQSASVASHAARMGKTYTAVATDMAKQQLGMAKAFGVPAKMIGDNMGKALQDLAHFGHLSTAELTLASTYATKLGVSVDKLAGAMDATSTFDQAAESASKLNEQYSLNLDTQELLMAQNPGEKIDLYRKAFAASGKDMSKLLFQDKQLIKSATGMGDEMMDAAFASKNAGVSFDKMQETSKKLEKTTMTTTQAMTQLASSIQRLTPSGGQIDGGFFAHIIEGFSMGVTMSGPFLGMITNIKRSLFEATLGGINFGRLFVDIFPGVKKIFGSIADIFEPTAFKALFADILSIFKGFQTGSETDLKGAFDAIKKRIVEFFDSKGDAVKNLLEGLKAFGNALWFGIKAAFSWVFDQLKSLWNSFWKDWDSNVAATDSLAQSIKKSLSETASSIGDWISKSLGPALISGMQSAAVALANAAKVDVPEKLLGAAKNIASEAGSIFSPIWSALGVLWHSQEFQDALSALGKGIKDLLMKTLSDMFSAVWTSGTFWKFMAMKAAIGAIEPAMVGVAKIVLGKIASVGKSILNAMLEALGLRTTAIAAAATVENTAHTAAAASTAAVQGGIATAQGVAQVAATSRQVTSTVTAAAAESAALQAATGTKIMSINAAALELKTAEGTASAARGAWLKAELLEGKASQIYQAAEENVSRTAATALKLEGVAGSTTAYLAAERSSSAAKQVAANASAGLEKARTATTAAEQAAVTTAGGVEVATANMVAAQTESTAQGARAALEKASSLERSTLTASNAATEMAAKKLAHAEKLATDGASLSAQMTANTAATQAEVTAVNAKAAAVQAATARAGASEAVATAEAAAAAAAANLPATAVTTAATGTAASIQSAAVSAGGTSIAAATTAAGGRQAVAIGLQSTEIVAAEQAGATVQITGLTTAAAKVEAVRNASQTGIFNKAKQALGFLLSKIGADATATSLGYTAAGTVKATGIGVASGVEAGAITAGGAAVSGAAVAAQASVAAATGGLSILVTVLVAAIVGAGLLIKRAFDAQAEEAESFSRIDAERRKKMKEGSDNFDQLNRDLLDKKEAAIEEHYRKNDELAAAQAGGDKKKIAKAQRSSESAEKAARDAIIAEAAAADKAETQWMTDAKAALQQAQERADRVVGKLDAQGDRSLGVSWGAYDKWMKENIGGETAYKEISKDVNRQEMWIARHVDEVNALRTAAAQAQLKSGEELAKHLNEKRAADLEKDRAATVSQLGPINLDNAQKRFEDVKALASKVMGKDFDVEKIVSDVRKKLEGIDWTIVGSDVATKINTSKVDILNIVSIFDNLGKLIISINAASTVIKDFGSKTAEIFTNNLKADGPIDKSIKAVTAFFTDERFPQTAVLAAATLPKNLSSMFQNVNVLIPQIASTIEVLKTKIDSGVVVAAFSNEGDINKSIGALTTFFMNKANMATDISPGTTGFKQFFEKISEIGVILTQTNLATATQNVQTTISGVMNMIDSLKLLSVSTANIGNIDLNVALQRVANSVGLSANKIDTFAQGGVTINLNLKVTMDTGKVEKTILESGSLIRDRINLLIESSGNPSTALIPRTGEAQAPMAKFSG